MTSILKERRRCVFASHLGAGQDDGFTQVFTHEGQGGGCVGHSIGTVEDHEAVKVLVVFLQTQRSRTRLSFGRTRCAC